MADRQGIINALERIDSRAAGEEILPVIAKVASSTQRDRKAHGWKDSESVRRFVALTIALYASRRISRQQYVFFASSPVEHFHDRRWTDGAYDDELDEIQREMKVIAQRHGLKPDEYWPVGQAPKEYQLLSDRYDAVLEKGLIRALREFELADLADQMESDPEEFERLRERGHRSVFHKDETVAVLKDIVIQYEVDASRAASAQAYSAAVTLLGAGLEGLLMIRCLRSKRKAMLVAASLPRRLRPRATDDPTTWGFETLIETCYAAGWLPPISTTFAEYRPEGLAHVLRKMRNLVHPARRAREYPWCETDERDYKDAESIYLILLSKLLGNRSKKDRDSEATISHSA
jgi:hypothetical protein